ncbi:hypothetical protein L207DRAFT_576899 [Hyaloscypha variabilis F]|uniref:Uncharacterized protein n=1 Tax=Hyaloscypha variabilis (strain UAMH 11265 / GT02V1 / F) TaxID=1149755 RepID=A0A2J6S5H1_HYAVF|nr:hypothetical protein L207DRAFT_576899 [Hyaloscypha variabilis F]
MRLFSQSPGSILMFIVLIALSGHYLTHVNALPPSSLLQTGTGLVTKSTVQTFPKSAYVARSVFKRAFGPDDIIYIAVAVCMVLLLAFIGVCICRGHTCVPDLNVPRAFGKREPDSLPFTFTKMNTKHLPKAWSKPPSNYLKPSSNNITKAMMLPSYSSLVKLAAITIILFMAIHLPLTSALPTTSTKIDDAPYSRHIHLERALFKRDGLSSGGIAGVVAGGALLADWGMDE